MRPSRFSCLGIVALAVVAALCCPIAVRCYEWEFEPRQGELRLNRFQYKASHNSYDVYDDLPFSAQIDDWNTWMVELDLWWCPDRIQVSHGYGDCNGRTLDECMHDIGNTDLTQWRVTFVYFEFKDANLWPSKEVFKSVILGSIADHLDLDRVYTPIEFESPNPTGDYGRWPSMQELVRRGKHFVFLWDGEDMGNVLGGEDDYFFATRYGTPAIPPEPTNRCFVQAEVTDDANGTVPIGPLGDFYLYRAWPEYEINIDWGQFYTNCMLSGFNFVATEQHQSHDMMRLDEIVPNHHFHRSQPFVFGDPGVWWGYGTRPHPAEDGDQNWSVIEAAIEEYLDPKQDVLLRAGTYVVSGPIALSKAVVIRANGGSVVFVSE